MRSLIDWFLETTKTVSLQEMKYVIISFLLTDEQLIMYQEHLTGTHILNYNFEVIKDLFLTELKGRSSCFHFKIG